MLELERVFFRREKEGESYRLSPLKSGDTVAVGDQLEVRLTVKARSQFEYVHLKDPRGVEVKISRAHRPRNLSLRAGRVQPCWPAVRVRAPDRV